MKYSDITSDILAILSDGKCHTYDEIATELEVGRNTVRRHVESLSYRHSIEFYRGQRTDGKRGIQLDISRDSAVGGLSDDALDLLIESLKAYGNQIPKNKEATYKWLVNKYTSIKESRQENH